MPLVRIDLPAGRSPDHRRAVADAVHDALVATIDVPVHDRFQVIAEHAADHLLIDATYLGIARSPDAVIVSITISEGRSVERKKALFAAIADGVHARAGLARADVMVVLTEVKKENWSFGDGIAQYAA